MPGGKSIYVGGQSSVVLCPASLYGQLETNDRPWPYEVDKDFGRFYYLINRASKQRVREINIYEMKPYDKYFVPKAYHFIAEGDWSFQAFLRKAWKNYLENPVNPVKK